MHVDVIEARSFPRLSDSIALRAKLPMVAPDAVKAWVHLAYEGEWSGHPDGDFKFDQKTFEAIIANFEGQVNPIACTFGHPDENLGFETPAAGWIHKLEIRECETHGTELWGLVEFTQRTAKLVRAGELRFCSVVVSFKTPNRKTSKDQGATLRELGFTNNPFLDGQHEMKLSFKKTAVNRDGKHIYNETRNFQSMATAKEFLQKALEQSPDDASLDQIRELAAQLESQAHKLQEDGAEHKDQAAKALEALAEASGMTFEEALAALAERMEAVAKALKGDASEEEQSGPDASSGDASQVEEAPPEMSTTVNASDDFSEVAKAKVAALSAKVKEGEEKERALSDRIKKLEADQTNRKIDDAIKAGTFLEKDREKLVKLGNSDSKLLDEWLADGETNPAVPTETVYKSGPSDEKDFSVDKDLLELYDAHLKAVEPDKDKRRQIALDRIKSRTGLN